MVNWLLGPIRAILTEKAITINELGLSPLQLATLINLVDSKKISQQNALQQLLPALDQYTDVLETASRLNLLIVEDDAEVDHFIQEVLNKYEAQVKAYKSGKKGVLGLFVGEVMKMAKGKADAKKVSDLIEEKLK
ncbi:Aspartyl/glutamyl-tRNA(Asn/Gln) amidotransferase subunit B [compost metagenome]